MDLHLEPEVDAGRDVLLQAPRRALTPVYGTTLPPRFLSGMVRRRAYRIPTHRARHFLLLLVADRLDRLEARLPRLRRRRPPTTTLA